MRTKRLIAGSRHPIPPADGFEHVPLGISLVVCSIGASRSAPTPGILHGGGDWRLIAVFLWPVSLARPVPPPTIAAVAVIAGYCLPQMTYHMLLLLLVGGFSS
jgi:hypothetical protein